MRVNCLEMPYNSLYIIAFHSYAVQVCSETNCIEGVCTSQFISSLKYPTRNLDAILFLFVLVLVFPDPDALRSTLYFELKAFIRCGKSYRETFYSYHIEATHI